MVGAQWSSTNLVLVRAWVRILGFTLPYLSSAQMVLPRDASSLIVYVHKNVC